MKVWLLLALLLLVGCDDAAPRLGSAQALAADSQAHARATRAAADQAGLDVAAKSARAALLAQAAEREPTAERIAAAADARVEEASARAVEQAVRRLAREADAQARQDIAAAQSERSAEAKAAADARWVELTRWIGMAGVGSGVLLGALIGYLTRSPRAGLLAGGLLAATGIAVLTFGATLHWLPWLVAAAVVAVLGYWAVHHSRLHSAKAAADNVGTFLAREWQIYADALHDAAPKARASLDAGSIEAQGHFGIQDQVSKVLAKAEVCQ